MRLLENQIKSETIDKQIEIPWRETSCGNKASFWAGKSDGSTVERVSYQNDGNCLCF